MANTYIRIGIGLSGGSDSFEVKVSFDDKNPGFLDEKLDVGSDKLTKSVTDPGLEEVLVLDVDQTKIDHDQLLNYDETKHRVQDDTQTSDTTLWSSQKIQDELDTKVDKVSSTDNAIVKFDGVEGAVQDSGIIIDDLNNVTGVNDLTIEGDLTVNGNITTLNTATLDVEDANITVNKGGDQASADSQSSGLTVEMSDAVDAQIGYDSTLESKFKIGEVGSEQEILTTAHTQIVSNKTVDTSNTLEYDNSSSALESTNVKEALDELDERDLFNKYHLYEDNPLAFADAEPGVPDPSNLDRDGWYYENLNPNEKINWYYFDGTTQGTVTLGDISAYAVMTFDSIASAPALAVYTFPTGTNDVFPGDDENPPFAHSVAVYDGPLVPTPVVGQKYVVYFGENPNIHPELPRIQLTYINNPLISRGDLNPSEIVLTVALNSNSAEPVGEVKYMVEELGIYSPTVKHSVALRIKKANESDLQAHINSTEAHDAVNITYDNSISGLDALNVNDAIDEVQQNLEDHIQDNIDAHPALSIKYENTSTGLDAVNAQEAIDQLYFKGTNTSFATKEPTGFPLLEESIVEFSGSTLTIRPNTAITPYFNLYVKGNLFLKSSAESVQLDTNVSGNHFFYYDETGTLQTSSSYFPEIFTDNAIVSVVYWNTDTNSHMYFAEERHGLQMDGATHIYLHTTFGARYISGLALENFDEVNFYPGLDIDSGSIRDEDLLLSIDAVTDPANIGVMYRQGTQWKKVTGLSHPLLYTGSTDDYIGFRVPYNKFDPVLETWSLEDPNSNNEFILVHYFATNDKETPIVAIQGTDFYGDVPSAKNAAATEINLLSGLPFLEFVAIGTVVYQTSLSFSGDSPRSYAKYVPIEPGVNYVDFRGTQPYTPAGTATSHSILSGLANDDHKQYLTEERANTWYQEKFPFDTQETNLTLSDNTTTFQNTGISFSPVNLDGQIVNSFSAYLNIERGFESQYSEYVIIKAIRNGYTSEWFVTIESTGLNSGVEFDVVDNDILYKTTSTGFDAYVRIKVEGLGYSEVP